MNGDLIFIDFKKGDDDGKSTEPSDLKSIETESKADKIKRLAAQIESGEYELPSDELAERLLKESLEDLDFE